MNTAIQQCLKMNCVSYITPSINITTKIYRLKRERVIWLERAGLKRKYIQQIQSKLMGYPTMKYQKYLGEVNALFLMMITRHIQRLLRFAVVSLSFGFNEEELAWARGTVSDLKNKLRQEDEQSFNNVKLFLDEVDRFFK